MANGYTPASTRNAPGPPSANATLPISAIPTPTNLTDLATLASGVTGANIASTQAAQAAQIPNAPGLAAQESNLVGQELAGQVPQDVMRLLQQQGAEGTTVTGGNPQAAYLRALGLTSLGQEQAGVTNLASELASHPAAPIFNAGQEILTPGQAGQLALGQEAQTLAQQTEADRVRLEQQRLALEAARAASGGPGAGAGGSLFPTAPPADTGIYSYGGIPGVGFSSGTDVGYGIPQTLTYEDIFGPGTAPEGEVPGQPAPSEEGSD